MINLEQFVGNRCSIRCLYLFFFVIVRRPDIISAPVVTRRCCTLAKIIFPQFTASLSILALVLNTLLILLLSCFWVNFRTWRKTLYIALTGEKYNITYAMHKQANGLAFQSRDKVILSLLFTSFSSQMKSLFHVDEINIFCRL